MNKKIRKSAQAYFKHPYFLAGKFDEFKEKLPEPKSGHNN